MSIVFATALVGRDGRARAAEEPSGTLGIFSERAPTLVSTGMPTASLAASHVSCVALTSAPAQREVVVGAAAAHALVASLASEMLRSCLTRPVRLVRPAARRYCAPAEVSLETFHRAADHTLQGITEVMEDYADDNATMEMDVDLAGDVLNVALGARGHFVLNKQSPNQQIWMSSPVCGPQRYDFRADTLSWHCRRENKGLLTMLADDFEALTGDRLSFDDLEQEVRDAVKDEV